MDQWILLVVAFLVLICNFVITSHLTRRKQARLPPGPYPFPIIGNLLQLGHKPHQTLANLSKTYGPLMSLKLGQLTTIVVSSPEMAKSVLQKFDQALSSRAVIDAVRILDHHKHSIVWLPVESKWRGLRKMCKEQLFSVQRLDSSQVFRQKKVKELLEHVNTCSQNGEAVDIGRAAFTTSINSISNTLFSMDVAQYRSGSSQDLRLRDIVQEVLDQMGRSNIADYFPIFQLVDPQGVRRRVETLVRQEYAMLDSIMKQRLQSKASGTNPPVTNDVLEALLDASLKKDAELSYNDIIHLILDLFKAGSDTVSSTLEWAMAELMHHPEKMAKAKAELKEVLGNEKCYQIQESDISRLPYLQALVKETLRLHPPAPLLIPRKAETDVEINGFTVPKNAQILVNVWCIGRDASAWTNPNSFVPERFLESRVGFKGHDHQFIPFGAGRRICPGLPLGDRIVHLTLASLLRSFDWKLERGLKPEDMDMDEQFGITLRKATPLKAIPVQI